MVESIFSFIQWSIEHLFKVNDSDRRRIDVENLQKNYIKLLWNDDYGETRIKPKLTICYLIDKVRMAFLKILWFSLQKKLSIFYFKIIWDLGVWCTIIHLNIRYESYT